MRMKNIHERLNIQGLCQFFLEGEMYFNYGRDDSALSPEKRDTKFYNDITGELMEYSFILLAQDWSGLDLSQKESKIEKNQDGILEKIDSYANFNFEMGVKAGLRFAFDMIGSVENSKNGCR